MGEARLDRYRLGRVLGKGTFKTAYSVVGRPDLVLALVSRSDPFERDWQTLPIRKSRAQLARLFHDERRLLDRFSSLGVGTITYLKVGTHQGRPAALMPRYALSSRDFHHPLRSRLLDETTFEHARQVRHALAWNDILIFDSQYFIDSAGRLLLADPFALFHRHELSRFQRWALYLENHYHLRTVERVAVANARRRMRAEAARLRGDFASQARFVLQGAVTLRGASLASRMKHQDALCRAHASSFSMSLDQCVPVPRQLPSSGVVSALIRFLRCPPTTGPARHVARLLEENHLVINAGADPRTARNHQVALGVPDRVVSFVTLAREVLERGLYHLAPQKGRSLDRESHAFLECKGCFARERSGVRIG
jgi:hypothetical protein